MSMVLPRDVPQMVADRYQLPNDVAEAVHAIVEQAEARQP
jgi:hypothetical protein